MQIRNFHILPTKPYTSMVYTVAVCANIYHCTKTQTMQNGSKTQWTPNTNGSKFEFLTFPR